MTPHEAASKLSELRDQMTELLKQAEAIVRGTHEYEAARVYWLAYIKSALGSDEYPTYTTHSTTMRSTIEALGEPIDASDE